MNNNLLKKINIYIYLKQYLLTERGRYGAERSESLPIKMSKICCNFIHLFCVKYTKQTVCTKHFIKLRYLLIFQIVLFRFNIFNVFFRGFKQRITKNYKFWLILGKTLILDVRLKIMIVTHLFFFRENSSSKNYN